MKYPAGLILENNKNSVGPAKQLCVLVQKTSNQFVFVKIPIAQLL